MNGTITNATITASGVSNVYLIGLENFAIVNLAGTANVYVKPANGELPLPQCSLLSLDSGKCLSDAWQKVPRPGWLAWAMLMVDPVCSNLVL